MRTWAVSLGAVASFLVLFWVTSLLTDSAGRSLLDSLNPILITALGSGGLLASAAGPYLVRTQRDAEISREEVKNHHETNFREDHDELTGLVRGISVQITHLTDRVAVVDTRINSIDGRLARNEESDGRLREDIVRLHSRIDTKQDKEEGF